ncbi:hypothetical protein GCM10025867_40410 [Frondihabitans sucicola]|uniref:HTH marR-type domain-containing protein n=1 Tax=Frondihabitans sucicola TaxID=1268041 RepID=A0ABN6Y724_9MICO|nr:MarR family winged helix-turn-helix transcriptional regulator [Frondihabitans sucicola]BDZ51800.1 hypothetical protein GCM10025867_40410 [Frondihabitans sucicola]
MKDKGTSQKSLAVSAWESLFRAQVTIMRELTACFPTGEISFNEYDVLFNLSNQPERRARLKELTQHLLLTQPSISRLVDRLTTKGVVEKLSDPGDGRGIIVAMTPLGSDIFRSTAVRHAEAISRRVGGTLDHDELEQLMALCTKLRLGPTIADVPEAEACPVLSDDETDDSAVAPSGSTADPLVAGR